MLKWLSSLLIVIVAFLIVLLSLGYLLKENEQTTTLLKAKLDQQKLETQKTKALLQFVDNTPEKSAIKQQQKIIIENLTCLSQQQCQVINTYLIELNCYVTVNVIGASLLAKHQSTVKNDNACIEHTKPEAHCLQNLCTIN